MSVTDVTMEVEAEKPTELTEEQKTEQAEKLKAEAEKLKAEEEAKKAEEAREKEVDQKADKRQKVKTPISLNQADSTVSMFVTEDNVCSIVGGTEGFNCLWAGIRANSGMKKGRYMFEVRLLENPRNVRIGVTTQKQSLFFDGDEAIGFENMGACWVAGKMTEKAQNHHTKMQKKDIVQVVINLDAGTENENTVSLFLNGVRAAPPVAIPENMQKKTLFPCMATKNGTMMQMRFVDKTKELPFTCTMIGEAANADIEVSKIQAPKNPEILMPVGFDAAEVAEQMAEENQDHVLITQKAMTAWGQLSGVIRDTNTTRTNNPVLDQTHQQLSFLARPRKYIWCLGNNLNATLRKDLLEKFGSTVTSKALVLAWNDTAAASENVANYSDFTFPSKEEGFDAVEYKDAKEKDMEEKLAAWKKQCRIKAKADDLKVGTYYKDNMAKFEKVKKLKHKLTAPKKTDKKEESNKEGEDAEMKEGEKANGEAKKEGEEATEKKEKEEEEEKEPEREYEVMTEFSEEDWMLATLRSEFHSLLHAFRIDLDDEERTAFPAIHMQHYYKQYNTQKPGLFYNVYGITAKDAEGLKELLELVPEVAEVDEDGMVKAKLPQETDLEEFINFTEEQRIARKDRIDAGDESAALKFNARQALQAAYRGHQKQDGDSPSNKGKGYGGRGGGYQGGAGGYQRQQGGFRQQPYGGRGGYGGAQGGGYGGGYGGNRGYQGGGYAGGFKQQAGWQNRGKGGYGRGY